MRRSCESRSDVSAGEKLAEGNVKTLRRGGFMFFVRIGLKIGLGDRSEAVGGN